MYYLSDFKTGEVKSVLKTLKDVAVTGSVVTKVPDAIKIDTDDKQADPPVLRRADILRQKYDGILAQNGFFQNIYSNDFETEAQDLDLTTCTQVGVGKHLVWAFNRNAGSLANLQTVNLPIVPGTYGTFKAYWEVYSRQLVTEENGRGSAYYVEEDPSLFDVEISVDSGLSFTTIPFMQATTLLTPGSDVVLRFVPSDNSQRYYLGAFALLY